MINSTDNIQEAIFKDYIKLISARVHFISVPFNLFIVIIFLYLDG
jgi:hypothetical protein